MNTPTVLSDSSSRYRRRRKSIGKRSIIHSDYFDEPADLFNSSKEQDGPRSSSVCTGLLSIPGVPPRMAQLETLEAKMANIEVSLSAAPRRRKSGSLGGRAPPQAAAPAPPTGPPPPQEQDPDNKNAIINRLKDQLSPSLGGSQAPPGAPLGAPLGEQDRRAVEARVARLSHDTDTKRLVIKNLKGALERLDITDNIDVRIQQAELEYQLGREELELLTLLEHSRALTLLLEQDDNHNTKQDLQTIYSCIDCEVMTLHAVQVDYDPKSPQFGAGVRPRRSGLWLEWALEHTGMCKGDRLLEVNGKLVLSKSKEDMVRLLSISPSPAQLVVLRGRTADGYAPAHGAAHPQTALAQVGGLRAELGALREQAEEARRTKDGLRSDNLRLTHRISYLEEQVQELLDRNKGYDTDVQHSSPLKVLTSTVKMQKNVTNINITSEPTQKTNQPQKSDVQVFQKGPDVTAIVANIPGLEIGGKDTVEASAYLPIIRPRSNQSNVSSTQIAIGHSPRSNGSKSSNSVDQNEKAKSNHMHSTHNHVHYNHKSSRSTSGRHSLQPSRSSNSLDHGDDGLDSNSEMKHGIRQSLSHHSIHKSNHYDYNSETSAAIEIIKKNQKHYMEANYKNLNDKKYFSSAQSDDNSDISKCYKKDHKKPSSIFEYFDKASRSRRVPKILDYQSEEALNKNEDEKIQRQKQEKALRNLQKSIMLDRRIPNGTDAKISDRVEFHPDRDYVDHRIDGKIIQNAHKSSRRMSKLHLKNTKAIDCDSEPTRNDDDDKYRKSRTKVLDYTSEPNSVIQGHYKKHFQHLERPRPMPPKKPLRLSLHRAQSMQSVEPNQSQGETFYLHDPIQRQASANDVANKEESKFSIPNGRNVNEVFFSNQTDYRIKPDNCYSQSERSHSVSKSCLKNGDFNGNSGKHLGNENLSNDHDHILQENIKKVKKRAHNGKLSQPTTNSMYSVNGHESENGYVTSRSESLSCIPKMPTNNSPKLRESKIFNGDSDVLRFSAVKDRSKAELQMKSMRDEYSKTGMNGYCIYDRSESASETSRAPSRADSCQSGFKWPSSVFKNIRIESPTRHNGHVSDSGKK